MKLSLYEQETILLYNQAEDTAEVYTHDRKLMEKLTRLSKKHPEQVCKKDKHNFTVADFLEACKWVEARFIFSFKILEKYGENSISRKKKVSSILDEL